LLALPFMPSYRILLADYANGESAGHIPQLFKRAGCTVELFCSRSSWLRKNKFWDVWHATAANDVARYAQQLQKLVTRRAYDWVVLVDDAAIRIMNDTITDDELAKKILPLAHLSHRYSLGSKIGLSQLCTAQDIATPAYAVHDGTTDVASVAAAVGFPLLVKVDRSGGGKGVFFCADTDDLSRVMKRVTATVAQPVMLQKYIAGQNISIEALYRNGSLIGYASSHVLKNIQGEFSVSTLRDYQQFPGVEEQLRRIGAAIGIHGFTSMTLMRDSVTHTNYLVEADLRPHGWFTLTKFCGVDFSVAIQRFLSGDQGILQPTSSTSVIVRYFSRDIRRLLIERNVRELLRWCVNADGRWRFIPWHDKRLFFATVGAALHTYAYVVARVLGLIWIKRKLKRARSSTTA
jgi:predicted ATP-grasp superfamily ATP-dependent carboligase